MGTEANFAIRYEGKRLVIIEDLGPWNQHPTVTNDASAVVEHLRPLLRGRRLYYIDSEGELDELLVRAGKFAGFAPA